MISEKSKKSEGGNEGSCSNKVEYGRLSIWATLKYIKPSS